MTPQEDWNYDVNEDASHRLELSKLPLLYAAHGNTVHRATAFAFIPWSWANRPGLWNTQVELPQDIILLSLSPQNFRVYRSDVKVIDGALRIVRLAALPADVTYEFGAVGPAIMGRHETWGTL